MIDRFALAGERETINHRSPLTGQMEIKRGIAVSPGVAIGPALVLDTEWFRIPQRYIDGDSAAEIQRLRDALVRAAQEATENQQAISDKVGRQYGAIFGAHATLLEDPTLHQEIEGLIRDQRHAAEYAVSRVM